MKNLLLYALSIGVCSTALAQKKKEKQDSSPALAKIDYSSLSFRSIGPAVTSGRIADLAVDPSNPDVWYIAAASGGVWKSTNHGLTYSPIFDHQGSYSIGCITIDPNNSKTIWVGSGENNNQRSVAYGDGVYKSVDGGATWKNVGLPNSEHIGMIQVDPRNSNVVWVAAYGPVWSDGGDRGLYVTRDGGNTWTKALDVSPYTGFNEVHLDPRNPDIIFATSHQRQRKVYTYISGGPESDLYKSTDGGKSFTKITAGLPSGEKGRFSLSISPVNPDIHYLMIEESGFYRSENNGQSWNKVGDHQTSGNYYVEIYASPHDVNTIYSMDTYAQISTDGGKTFKPLGENGKHVDNHAIWIDPKNPSHLLIGCDGGLYETWDHASTWHFKPNLPITQFYRVALDNNEPFYYVYGGTQDNFSLGGPSRTIHDRGTINSDWFVTQSGDGFESQVDPIDPNIVYAQAQYGALQRFDRRSGEGMYIQPPASAYSEALRWNWDAPLLISPHNHKTLYFAANVLFKSDDQGNSWKAISGDLTRQLDRNTLPIMGKVWSIDAIAKNKSTTIYGNIVALSESPLTAGKIAVGTDDGLIQLTSDDGGSWKSTGSFPGVPANTYVNDLKWSQHDDNTLYAAFNNHKNGDFTPYIYKSTDGGVSWSNISGNLPKRGSVYSIAEDHIDKTLVFAGTEFGVFFTKDNGANWIQLKGGLPTIAIRDMEIQKREDDLVLASFGRGFYVLDDYSLLREIKSEDLESKATIFPIKDGLLFQESHPNGYGAPGFLGASLYMAPNPPIGVTFDFYTKETIATLKDKRKEKEKDNANIQFPSKDEIRAEARDINPYFTFIIRDLKGVELRRINKPQGKGLQRFTWDGRASSIASTVTKGEPISNASTGPFVPEGDYTIELWSVYKDSVEQLSPAVSFHVKHLNNATFIAEDPQALFAFQQELDNHQQRMNKVTDDLKEANQKLQKITANIRNLPGMDLAWLSDAMSISDDLNSYSITLYGDKAIQNHEFEIIPGIEERLGYIEYISFSCSAAPTKSQTEELKSVLLLLDQLEQKLDATKINLELLAQKTYSAGAPVVD